MTGKLRIIRCLGNPRRAAKKKKKAARKKPITRRAKPATMAGYIVRAIVPKGAGYTHVFWTGAKWSAHRSFRKKFIGAVPAPELGKIKRKLPAGWVSLDVMPA